MDIQKEREVFEKWFATRYPNIQKTIDLHNNHESIVFRKNQAEAWQAAKAQAVPGWISVGDSLPPVDETVLVCWDYAADIEPEKEYLTLDEDCNEYWPNCQDEPPTHWLPLPKVIKAQEPAK